MLKCAWSSSGESSSTRVELARARSSNFFLRKETPPKSLNMCFVRRDYAFFQAHKLLYGRKRSLPVPGPGEGGNSLSEIIAHIVFELFCAPGFFQPQQGNVISLGFSGRRRALCQQAHIRR